MVLKPSYKMVLKPASFYPPLILPFLSRTTRVCTEKKEKKKKMEKIFQRISFNKQLRSSICLERKAKEN